MDIEQLITPIEGDNAVGIYLKSDRTRFRVARNAFNAAQSAYRHLLETPESALDEELTKKNTTHWQTLEEICSDILSSQSKDIEICCWWIASQAFTPTPLNSLAVAMEGLHQLLTTFWPNIHPFKPDEKLKGDDDNAKQADRVTVQLRPLIQLLGESESSGLLYMPLQVIPLIEEINHSEFLMAKKNNRLPDLKQQAQKCFAKQKNSIKENILQLGTLLKILEKLDTFIAEQSRAYQVPAISCRFLRNTLNNCLETIRYLVGDRFDHWPLDTVPEIISSATENITPASPAHQNNPVSAKDTQATGLGAIQNRNHAFQQMRLISNYFLQHEPHSPISFMIEKIIRWGYLSFPELMEELTRGNQDMINQIGLLTGMNENDPAIIPDDIGIAPNTQTIAPASPAPEANVSSAIENNEVANNSKDGGEINNSPSSDFQW